MKFTRYSKWSGIDWSELGLDELLDKLTEFLLQSGFQGRVRGRKPTIEHTLAALKEAIRQALLQGMLSDLELSQLGDEQGNIREEVLAELLDRLIERLLAEGYITVEDEEQAEGLRQQLAEQGRLDPDWTRNVKFKLTDKALDFLGYKALRSLLGSLGRSSVGRHDTNHLATGVEASEAPKPYEFGDTLNLDVNSTLLSAIQREGLGVPINLEYRDLMVHQSEYYSSCATVLMLDCSHSMILYGEDRFTPAKQVALALAHLIRTQYPGDSIRVVLFHDSAEEIPFSKLAQVQVGPYHTNTLEGLRLSRRLLSAQQKDMKQIIMITDGKPSAMFVEAARAGSAYRYYAEETAEGRLLYKNPMGLDPTIIQETLKEVAICRKSGILINTFMLTDDHYLVDFVKKVTEIGRGKAYFTTVVNLGQYVLYDYIRKKTKKIH
ncbi:MAG: VWA domain-containing protein [Acidobacteriota bacterium]